MIPNVGLIVHAPVTGPKTATNEQRDGAIFGYRAHHKPARLEDVNVLITESSCKKHIAPYDGEDVCRCAQGCCQKLSERARPTRKYKELETERKKNENWRCSPLSRRQCRPYPPSAAEPVREYSTQPSGKIRSLSSQRPSRKKSRPNRAQSRACDSGGGGAVAVTA